ncbi:hypothetical protein CYLTODRAFT_366419 [Cylindrobasidium torrendii FP15055 ss-10]|uniref:Zn(2)-C6 fungal-type domain-containing protein n=1 Tax=Cylindrobasidium torrendii FP15055 ss-10 TaxID=1314674 RepID=A0A0D7BS29_9AGAR|nr:hypothetical protein CYLTODRAFT_366419 [Cylindrobasidium torrendii FP15055 ss-10]
MAPTYSNLSEEELVVARLNGQVSCAECRRLKLKCNKKLPCGSCVKRNCESICPLGTLANGMGKKMVVSDAKDLHTRVATLGSRIQDLENALAQFQSTVTEETHPLLRPELLVIKSPLDHVDTTIAEPAKTEADPLDDIVDAFGTLAVSDKGWTKYFGSSGGAESLFLVGHLLAIAGSSDSKPQNQAGAEFRTTVAGDIEPPLLLKPIPGMHKKFPTHPSGEYDIPGCIDVSYTHLPSKERAWALTAIYFDCGPWSGQMVTQAEFVDEIIVPLYHFLDERLRDPSLAFAHPHSCHRLALAFAVFAVAVLVDYSGPPNSPESDVYAQISAGLMFLDSIFDKPEFATVQTLIVLAVFLNHGGRKYTSDGALTASSLAARLSQKIGLHYETEVWRYDPKILDRRRRLFWEVYAFDSNLSLKLGRPPTFNHRHIKCEFPVDEDATLDEKGKIWPGYFRLRCTFLRDLVCHVVEASLSAEPPTYARILELDSQLRLFRPMTLYIRRPLAADAPSKEHLRKFLLLQYRALSGIYIHRSFFVRAVRAYPENPLLSPYSASYLATYRCASGYIRHAARTFERYPETFFRWWSVWSSLFTSSVVLGIVSIRTLDMHTASRAFAEFGLAIEMFELSAGRNSRARHGLVILQSMRDKAIARFSSEKLNAEQVATFSSQPSNLGLEMDADEELEIFGGKTRLTVVVSKLLEGRQRAKGGRGLRRENSTSDQATPLYDPGVGALHYLPTEAPLDNDLFNSSSHYASNAGLQASYERDMHIPVDFDWVQAFSTDNWATVLETGEWSKVDGLQRTEEGPAPDAWSAATSSEDFLGLG